MAFTFTSPETVTKAAVSITELKVAFAGSATAAVISYCYVDQNGKQLPGTQGDLTVPPADFVPLWNQGMTLSAMYTYLASRLGFSSGTSAGDGTLH